MEEVALDWSSERRARCGQEDLLLREMDGAGLSPPAHPLCSGLMAPWGAYARPLLTLCRSFKPRNQHQMSCQPCMQWALGRDSAQLIKNDLCLLLFLLTFNKE